MQIRINQQQEEQIEVSYECQVIMPIDIYEELFMYIDAFDSECSGCGLIKKQEDVDEDGLITHKYIIDKVFLPKQQNSSATTDIDSDEIHEIMNTLIKEGNDPSTLKLHWHSHNNMNVFHSKTDIENYDELRTGEYLISLVLNKKREMLARIDFYEPIRISISGIKVFTELSHATIDKDVIHKRIEEIKKHQKVTTIKPIYKGFSQQTEYTYPVASQFYGYGTASDKEKKVFWENLEAVQDICDITVLYDKDSDPYAYRNNRTGYKVEVQLDELSNYSEMEALEYGAF